MKAEEAELLRARERADALVEALSGDVRHLADAIGLLYQKVAERDLTSVPIISDGVLARIILVGGQSAARIAVVSYTLVFDPGLTSLQFQSGKGRNWKNVSGDLTAGGIGAALAIPTISASGSIFGPVFICDVADDLALNANAASARIGGHFVYTTLETGP